MIGFPQRGILPANIGHPVGKFSPDESAEQCENSADQPCANDQSGSVNLLGYHVPIDEDSGADDTAHDDHGGVKETDSAYQLGSGHVPGL
jgi:hypothetical protein